MKKLTIVIPTTLSPDLYSLLNNLHDNVSDCHIYLVIDGKKHLSDTIQEELDIFTNILRGRNIDLHQIVLPYSVGEGGFYSHRAIAGFAHLVNTEYVCFLDQDNLVGPFHFEEMLMKMNKYPDLPFCYSYRTIVDKNGKFICDDECESLGWKPIMGKEENGYLVDTSCWFYRTDFIRKYSFIWHNGWGADRIFTMNMRKLVGQEVMEKACTGIPSLLYRLGGNPGSVQKEFFLTGNEQMKLLESNGG